MPRKYTDQEKIRILEGKFKTLKKLYSGRGHKIAGLMMVNTRLSHMAHNRDYQVRKLTNNLIEIREKIDYMIKHPHTSTLSGIGRVTKCNHRRRKK